MTGINKQPYLPLQLIEMLGVPAFIA